METITECLTCREALPDLTGRAGRRPQYCGPVCRREHRNALKRLEREVERLEAEQVHAEQRLAGGWNRDYYRQAALFFEAKAEQTRLDLAALRLGVWP